jgi:alkyldihydroxyacetonephosphate synthase
METAMAARQLKLIGWGYEDQQMSEAECDMLLARLTRRYGPELAFKPAPKAEEIELHAPRLELPAALKAFASTDKHERLLHTYGKAYPDYVRAFERDFRPAPDIVAKVRDEADIEAVFDWAAGANVAVIPFGGGTSVCGGVEPDVGGGYNGTLSLDLTGLDKVLEVDHVSRAARIQSGVRVPALEAQLKPHGLTLRHYPQSFEMATLGGMIATRSGGHFATLYTHIDDFVEALRSLTPAGVLESRRLPGSGAGPSPDRLMIGAEGALGVITEAWMRLQDRPTERVGTAVLFGDFYRAAEAVRVICQAALYPANVRLLDPMEAYNNGFGDGRQAVVVLAFEGADHPLDAWLARALEICRDFDGSPEAAESGEGHRAGAAGAWRNAFIRMPFWRVMLMEHAMVGDTFETAITWERFRHFHDAVKTAAEQAIVEATGRPGSVTCRFTHCYPDGPAPYFTFQAQGRHGALLEQWRQIKSTALDAVIAEGGTVTHHHAVGRTHMPWYERQRPALFAAALAGAKARLDPAGILNPGVLLPAPR